jgi:fructokinase
MSAPARGGPPARLLVVGESLVDIIRRGGDDDVRPGGSPLNVSVGLQRLDVPTALHSSFGADAHGLTIAQHLEASGVSVTPGTARDRPTSVALAVIGPDGGACYTFSVVWDPAPLEIASETIDAVHVGSVGTALEPGATTVEGLLRELRPTTVISFDPNVRPQLMGSAEAALPRVERFVALADVVKASDEDLAWLYPATTIPEIMAHWLALGPALVVVTHGSDGAHALARSGPVRVPALRADVIDTIGAGDSFMSGLLAGLSDLGLLRGDRRENLRAIAASDVAEVLQFAARCAAITVSRLGADPPTRRDLADGRQA